MLVFKLSHFFKIISDSHGTLHLALGLVRMHSEDTFKWEVTKFS